MRAQIKNIISKRNKKWGAYLRVQFVGLDKPGFYQTDVVPTFRNYKRWKDILGIGNVITGLVVMDEKKKKITADCHPILESKGKPMPSQQELF